MRKEREQLEAKIEEQAQKISYLQMSNKQLLEKINRYENLLEQGHLK